MIFSRALKFLSYQMLSRHGKGHGIHSPFVFNLVSKVFRNKIDPGVVLTIESIRKRNISNKRTINVLDLGAGSAKMKTNSRKVSEIARYTSVPCKYGVLLANMAAVFGKPDIIEFGTSLGISTMYMAAACPEAVVYTMEGCPEVSQLATENFTSAGLGNIRLLEGSFDDMLPGLRSMGITPGLVFIDGNHRIEPVTKYFSMMSEISNSSTVIVVDDIHSSDEMEKAWEEIKTHENVTFTVDIFRMGLIFFREGMDHIDYIIRY
jgi:predicted O-methyltransferase YrrM